MWESKISVNNIYSENWLLVYEAGLRGWLSSEQSRAEIKEHQCFGNLYSKNISFYNHDIYNQPKIILEELGVNFDLYGV